MRDFVLIVGEKVADCSSRGTVGSFQQWADVVGDDDYTFNKILPYFRKSTDFTPPNYAKRGAGGLVGYDASAFSPVGGPLQVSYSNFWQPISDYFRKAFVSLGLKPLLGFNSGHLLGFSEFTSTVDPRAETRSSSETSFLHAAMESSDLQVYQQTLAKRILFNADKTAIGVSVTTSGVSYVLSAKKEVILAAGVVSVRSKAMCEVETDCIVSIPANTNDLRHRSGRNLGKIRYSRAV